MDIRLKIPDTKVFTEAPAKLAKNLRFAAVVALTRTAKDIREREIGLMRQVFDKPTPWTLNSLAVKPATKTDLVAQVRKKEFGANSAGHILGPHIEGGARGTRMSEKALGGFVVPGKGMTLDRYGNLPASVYKKILSQLGLQRDATANASQSAKSKAKRKSEAYFRRVNVVFQRKGRTIMPALIITRPPRYTKRFRYFEKGNEVFNELFPAHFDRAIAQALSSSGFK